MATVRFKALDRTFATEDQPAAAEVGEVSEALRAS